MTAEWTNRDSDAACAEGWDIFEAGDGMQLQRDDDGAVFADDFDAWVHVWEQAQQDSPLHVRALAYLAEASPEEYESIAMVGRTLARLDATHQFH